MEKMNHHRALAAYRLAIRLYRDSVAQSRETLAEARKVLASTVRRLNHNHKNGTTASTDGAT